MPSYFLFFLLCSTCRALSEFCPSQQKIAPHCMCKDLGNGPMMMCENIMNPDELVVPIKETENHDMFSLIIRDSTLQYIPYRLFQKTNFKKIRLVGTQLMSLSESDLAFEGLETTLEEFRVTDAHYVTQWSWNQMKNLEKLQMIEIDLVSLGSVEEPFPTLKSLIVLGIARADISFIVDHAFRELENLRILILRNNDIKDFKRNMLPQPANQLTILDLSGNKLSFLPSDIFREMPSLSTLILDDNKLVTLNEAIFSEVMDIVDELSLLGNELRCDCRMRWIVDIRQPREFYAVCSHPDNLKGESVQNLVAKVLVC